MGQRYDPAPDGTVFRLVAEAIAPPCKLASEHWALAALADHLAYRRWEVRVGRPIHDHVPHGQLAFQRFASRLEVNRPGEAVDLGRLIFGACRRGQACPSEPNQQRDELCPARDWPDSRWRAVTARHREPSLQSTVRSKTPAFSPASGTGRHTPPSWASGRVADSIGSLPFGGLESTVATGIKAV
jgi:hypothetical protein